MNNIDKMKLTEQSEHYEAFLFNVNGHLYRETSGAEWFQYDGNSFVPSLIKRSGFEIGPNQSAKCSVDIKSDSNIATALLTENNMDSIELSIIKVFADDSTGLVIFKGNMVDMRVSKGIVTITFEDILRFISRSICRVRMQSLCNNSLFDATCALDSEDFALTKNVVVDGKILTNNDFNSFPSGYFTLGRCSYNGITRIITRHDGDEIEIARPIHGLVTNESVTVLPGCDKLPETCYNRFSNIDNFVGMPYIPLKDPSTVAITNA